MVRQEEKSSNRQHSGRGSSNKHRRPQPSEHTPIRIDDTERMVQRHRLHMKVYTHRFLHHLGLDKHAWANWSHVRKQYYSKSVGRPHKHCELNDGFIDQSQHWSMHDQMPSDWCLTSSQWLYPCGVLHHRDRLLPNSICTPDSHMR